MKIASKIELEVSVKDRKFTSNTNIINNILDAYNGHTIKIIFQKITNKRSNKQNRYYFGVIIPIFLNAIKEEWGEVWSIHELHEFLKSNCNYEEFVNEDTGEIIRKVKSTTDNSTTEQEEFHENCRRLCDSFFNTIIPMPNEDLTLKF